MGLSLGGLQGASSFFSAFAGAFASSARTTRRSARREERDTDAAWTGLPANPALREARPDALVEATGAIRMAHCA